LHVPNAAPFAAGQAADIASDQPDRNNQLRCLICFFLYKGLKFKSCKG
jgi:hypothetical protein